MNKKYAYQTPGMFYAGSIEAKNEKEARANLRAWLNVARLPKGTAIWETTWGR